MLVLRSHQVPTSNPTRLRHRHADEHELLLVEAGQGWQLTDAGPIPCGPGAVFWYPPGVPHQSTCDQRQRFTCLLLFLRSADLADGEPGDGGRSLVQTIAARVPRGGALACGTATRRRLRLALRRALVEQRSADPSAPVAVRAEVTAALVALARDHGAVEAPVPREDRTAASRRHIERARAWLAEHAHQPIRLEDLLALGPLGRSRFLERFRADTGTTVQDLVVRHRLDLAEDLLRSTTQSLVAIALAAGFASQGHFARHFRARHGLPPGAWRQQRTG